MKVKISTIVHEVQYGPGDEKRYMFFASDMTGKYYAAVCPVEVEVEIPDNFDPRPGQIAALEAQKASIRAEFAAKVKEIDDAIANMQALEYTPADTIEAE